MIRRPFVSYSPTTCVERRGEPVAVLIGRRQYERLTLKYRGFSEAYEDFTREFDLDELAINPDKLFAGARDDSHGREVDL